MHSFLLACRLFVRPVQPTNIHWNIWRITLHEFAISASPFCSRTVQVHHALQTQSHRKPMYLYWFVLNKSMCDSLLILGDQASSNMPLSPTSKSPGSFPFRKQKKIPAALKEVMIHRTVTVFHLPIKADLIWPNMIKTVSSSQCAEVCLTQAIHNCLALPLAP